MARYLSLYRRRPNLVDINLQSGPYAPMAIGLAAGKVAASYDFYVGQNFDTGAFTKFQNVPASGGYTSPALSAPGVSIAFDGEQFSQSRTPYLTRFRFAPSDYTGAGLPFTVQSVSDSTPFWLQVIQNNLDGTSNTKTAPQLILPYSSQPNRPVLLSGTAPNGPTTPLEIQLPMQCDNLQVQNTSTSTNLMVAFEPGGPYFTVYQASVDGLNLYSTYPAASQLFVYGESNTCTFNVIAALRNNPNF
jgi:hypothetical protein